MKIMIKKTIMIRKTMLYFALFLLSTFSVNTLALEVGQLAPAFTIADTNGKQISLADFKGKTVVLEWTNHQCPFVKKHYNSNNMQSLQKNATDDGVVWLSIISSAAGKQGYVNPAKANALTKERDAHPSHVLLDDSGRIGKIYNAKTTPHMFIVDGDGIIQYMGAIDSKSSSRQSDIPNAYNYVKEALSEMKEGKKITHAKTRPYGCSVKYL